MNEVSYDIAVKALVKSFKKSVDDGFEDYGDNRLVPLDEEIQKAAEAVLSQEDRDNKVREEALAETRMIEWNRYHSYVFSYPKVEVCPAFLDKYYTLGGCRYLDETDMSLEDAMRYDMRNSYVDWFKEKRKLSKIEIDNTLSKSELKRLEEEYQCVEGSKLFSMHKDEDIFKIGINSFLKRVGMSQRRLSQKIGTVNATVYNWCVGRTEPNVKNISELIRAGMLVEEIFGYEIAAIIRKSELDIKR